MLKESKTYLISVDIANEMEESLLTIEEMDGRNRIEVGRYTGYEAVAVHNLLTRKKNDLHVKEKEK